MTEESVEKNVNKVGGSGAAVTETLHTPYKCAEKTNDKQRRQSDILRTPDALGDSTYIPTKHSKNGTVNATEKDGGTSEPDHYRVAVIETAVISVVVLLCLAAAVAIMFFLAVRPSYVKTISTYRGERLEHAWKKYDEKEQIEPGNICQNFPGPYKKLVKFIKRPYQVIGDPCEDYYGLVCSGICHIVPKGLCFWDVSRKFQRDCVYRKPDGDTVELWMNILAFTKRSHIPGRLPLQTLGFLSKHLYGGLPPAKIRLPSQCQEEIEKRYAEELSLIHGGNVRIKRALLERILFYIDYLNSKKVCVEERLMLYEIFCLSQCCYKPTGALAVEIGRIVCQATVGWRDDFTTYFRCTQNRQVIENCWRNDSEPDVCRPR